MTARVRWIASTCFAFAVSAQAALTVPMVDGDADGVADEIDDCPYSEVGTQVNREGCPLFADDGDADGIVDASDACPYSPVGAKVDAKGCALDADFDGIADGLDACPKSELAARVLENGCEVEQKPVLALQVRSPASAAAVAASESPARPIGPALVRPKAAQKLPTPEPKPTQVIAEARTPKASAPDKKVAYAPNPAPTSAADAPQPVTKPLTAKEMERRAAAVLVAQGEDQSIIRAPSVADKIQPEKPSAEYLARRSAASMRTAPPAAPSVVLPGSASVTPVRDENLMPPVKSAESLRIEALPDARLLPRDAPEALAAPSAMAAPPPTIEPLVVAPTEIPAPPVRSQSLPARPAAEPDAVNALLASLEQERGAPEALATAAPMPSKEALKAAAGVRAVTVRYAKLGGLELPSADAQRLAELAASSRVFMAQSAKFHLKLRAFTASTEDPTLAERRLALVRALLVGRGVAANRIELGTSIGGSPRVEVTASPH